MAISVISDAWPRVRPAGVRVIALVCFGIGAYLLVNGFLILAGMMSLASGAYLLGEYSTMGPLIYLTVAVALAGLGIALLRGWRWARRLAIVACALLVAAAVIPVSTAVIDGRVFAIFFHGLKIIAAIIAIRYLLLSEVVDYFAQH
jgi:hypothetical protein